MKYLSQYIVWSGILVALVVTVISLITSVYGLYRRQDIVQVETRRLQEAKENNARLKKALTQANSPFFVEKVARDELGLVKEGETVILMERPGLRQEGQETGGTLRKDLGQVGDVPNWKQWWGRFF